MAHKYQVYINTGTTSELFDCSNCEEAEELYTTYRELYPDALIQLLVNGHELYRSRL